MCCLQGKRNLNFCDGKDGHFPGGATSGKDPMKET